MKLGMGSGFVCADMYGAQEELSERTEVQCKLENAVRLAKESAVKKNQFLANMSHEVGFRELLLAVCDRV